MARWLCRPRLPMIQINRPVSRLTVTQPLGRRNHNYRMPDLVQLGVPQEVVARDGMNYAMNTFELAQVASSVTQIRLHSRTIYLKRPFFSRTEPISTPR